MKPRPRSFIPLARTASSAPALAAVLIGSALVLAGCGGPTPTASSPADSATSATAAATATGSAISGEEFCAALEAEQPELDKESGPDGAFITLSLALVDLYDSKNAVESMDASTMDALAASCPAVAAKALKSTGKSSFAEFR